MNNTLQSVQDSLRSESPPDTFSVFLKALWYDRKGEWDKAHGLVDHLEGREAARVHAYLHRKEGDISNAGYWYRQAGTEQPDLSLEKEWEILVRQFV
ncbi:MAG TPA: hypothetical protein VGM24_08370 [Puia sp.]